MKKVIKVLPMVTILILSILLVIHEDMSMREKYTNFDQYSLTGVHLDEEVMVDNSTAIDKVYEIAKENEIVLIRNVYNKKTDQNQLYIVSNNLVDFLSENLQLRKTKNNLKNGYVATYDSKDELQSYYIVDFLSNDRYVFFDINAMHENGTYQYGDYSVLYENESNLQLFLEQVSSETGIAKEKLLLENWGQIAVHTEIVVLIINISILFFTLTFLITIIFLLYRQSKKIGCLQLIGFSKIAIMFQIVKEYIYYIIATSIICLLLSSLFLPNISFLLLQKMFVLHMAIILLSIFITYVGLLMIARHTNISNIIKKQSLSKKISNICLLFKTVVICVLLVFIIVVLPDLSMSYELRNNVKGSEITMTYAVFPRFDVDNNAFEDNDNYLKFYQMISGSKIDYIYADFRDYVVNDQESLDNFEEFEKNGNSYRLASVDKNYLKKYDLDIFNESGESVELENIDFQNVFYLLPLSKQQDTKAFCLKAKEYNERINLQTDEVIIYYYKNRQFDTYNISNDVYIVDSPILRVINPNILVSYNQNYLGLDIVGSGMSTAFKIDVSKGKQETYKELQGYIDDAHLSEVITADHFVSYSDYLSDQTSRLQRINLVFSAGVFIVLFVYIFTVFQTFALYINSHMDEVLVKTILGFKRKTIFESIVWWNIGASLFPVISILSYGLFNEKVNFISIFIICSIFLLIDLFVLLSIVKFIKLTKINEKLKGG